MELYTSLVRLKQAMNGGQMPPMTPIPEHARAVVNPDFTIGLGALREDEERGLQCPVCGEFFHRLKGHLDRSHADKGGSQGITSALSIPRTAKLVSQRHSEIRSLIARRIGLGATGQTGGLRDPARQNKAHAALKGIRQTVGARNLRNSCEAQLRNRLIDLENELGRAPSAEDARSRISAGFVDCVIEIYGSWNAAKTAFGLALCTTRDAMQRRIIGREAVLESLRAYYDIHGSLPNSRMAREAAKRPLLPSPPIVCRALGVEGSQWAEAMRRAAAILNIYGGRYGLPEKQSA